MVSSTIPLRGPAYHTWAWIHGLDALPSKAGPSLPPTLRPPPRALALLQPSWPSPSSCSHWAVACSGDHVSHRPEMPFSHLVYPVTPDHMSRRSSGASMKRPPSPPCVQAWEDGLASGNNSSLRISIWCPSYLLHTSTHPLFLLKIIGSLGTWTEFVCCFSVLVA